MSFNYHKQAQNYYASSPTIILGSGASAAFNLPGMDALGNHLLDSIDPSQFEVGDSNEWTKFRGLLDGGEGLEAALHNVNFSEGLTHAVIKNTWNLIVPKDLEAFDTSIRERNFFPLGSLLRDYFSSTADSVDIITTNYDRLAEYACEQEGYHHYTGFSHGYRRLQKDPNYLNSTRVVNIWKVHGSLDWFRSPSDEVVGFGNIANIPDDFLPLIVTPGTGKYRETHLLPFRTVIQKADEAIEKASSYLAVGFGFNDEHIQEKLIHKCARDKASITIVTYKLSDETRKFLFDKNVENYLAIERGNENDESIIYSSLIDEPLRVPKNHWSLEGYMELIL